MTFDPNQPELLWNALTSRDRRFDGRIFVGVSSTGIYCRPICPARTPARRNVNFYPSAAAAEAAGFRPCRRCRPETAPGSAAWQGTSATVARALRLIDEGALDSGSVEALGARLGVSGRWLRNLFAEQLGASPLDVAQTRRVHLARRLLDESSLPLADVAAASGFGSARRLREALQRTFRRPASELRRAGGPATAGFALELRARAPFDGAPLLAFFATRAIPGVESVEGDTYSRTVRMDGVDGVLEVTAPAARHAVRLRLHSSRPLPLLPVVARVTRMFDLEADSAAIAQQLSRDPLLARALKGRAVRVPGAWDAFELGVRALLGQQITVAAARTLAARIVEACGEQLDSPRDALTHVFPTPAALAAAPLESLGLTRARAAALRGFAAAVAEGALRLDELGSAEEAEARLVKLPGIGPWTAQYIAMRAVHDPDAFPAGDLVVRQ
ncbi:MAG: DNA-3-methyladenine glycosylase 2 family protein, partial [Candidatus Eisenbacteria bacterium]|nr:DNA-3-methyladenine glycosylase 2 family protein [Candidatus Eisenbacteria bacterium]